MPITAVPTGLSELARLWGDHLLTVAVVTAMLLAASRLLAGTASLAAPLV